MTFLSAHVMLILLSTDSQRPVSMDTEAEELFPLTALPLEVLLTVLAELETPQQIFKFV